MAAIPRGDRAARQRLVCLLYAAAAVCFLLHIGPRSAGPPGLAATPSLAGGRRALPPEQLRPTAREELSSLKVNDLLEGRVAWTRGGMGVFIDVGATAYARLSGNNTWLASRLRRHDVLGGLRVRNVDLERRSIEVTCEHLEHYVENRVVPITDLEEGDVLDGQVVAVKEQIGAFIDVGVEREGLLAGPKHLVRLLRPKDIVKGLVVKYVNKASQLLGLSYPVTRGVTVNDIVEGEVVVADHEQVLVDLGGWRVARLSTPNTVAFIPKVGEVLKGCRVSTVNEERGLISVVIANLEDHLTSLSFFAKGDVVNGRVHAVVENVGIFVDIGAVKTAILDVPKKQQSEFENNQILNGLRISNVNIKRGNIAVRLGNDDYGPPTVLIGDVVQGKVVSATGEDVFIDIGLSKDARFQIPQHVPFMPKVGEVLEGLEVKHVNRAQNLITVTLRNFDEHLTPVSDLTAGAVVQGRVHRVITAGVFVDIGAARTARLDVPQERFAEFQDNQILNGLCISYVNAQRGTVTVKLG